MDTKRLHNINKIDLKIPGLKLISKIGEGGMSVVYLAKQISLNREIAVKVMRLEITDNDVDVQRFKHEAKTIAHLDHPNIINIYNIGQTSKGEIYFTMPYLNHGDFSSYILEDEQEFISLLKSICDGLSFAHERGIVHRDIKPENLLFDKFGNVQIADFGIAISKDGNRMTQEHQIVGSAQYMSPEQARSKKVDVHTDIYSLGVVIYERLTGSVPFDASDSISILVNHVSQEAEKLPVMMRHWQKLIDKCLAKSPIDRFQSMDELKNALELVPTNTFQRTGNKLQSLLSDKTGRHLLWFLPLLFLLIISAFFVGGDDNINSKMVEDDNIVSAQGKSGKINILPNISSDNDQVESKIISTMASETVNENKAKNQELSVNKSENIEDLTGQDTITNVSFEGGQNTTEIDTDLLSLDQFEKVEKLLLRANENIDNYRLSKPKDDNATNQLIEVLKISPDNPAAISAIERIGGIYFQLIKSSLEKIDLSVASRHTRSLKKFNDKTEFRNRNFEKQKTLLLSIVSKLDMANEKYSADNVKTLARIVKAIDPGNKLIEKLTSQALDKLGPQIGDLLIDDLGVESIVLTKNLAVNIKEVSVESYADFARVTNRESSKCKHLGGGVNSFFNTKKWDDPYFSQKPSHPVVCVTQADASAYAKWLSVETENTYRLPTKQDWLILASKESNAYSACKTANLAGLEGAKIRNKEDNFPCNDDFKFTAPVASYAKNDEGLYDVRGNVSEWLACSQSPCDSPTSIGSSWFHGKQSNKLSQTEAHKINSAYSYVGFRLVRDL